MGLADKAIFSLVQGQASKVKGGGITLSASGVRLAEARLKALPDKLRFKHLRSIYNAACRPLLKHAREDAPTDDGALQRSLIKKVRINKRRQYALVGAEYSIAPHAHLVEFGTVARFRKQAGGWFDEERGMGRFTNASTGTMPPRPFMRRAFEATKRIVQNTIEKGLLRALQKEANKTGRLL